MTDIDIDTSAEAVDHAATLRKLAGDGDGYFSQTDIARLYAAASDLESMRAERDALVLANAELVKDRAEISGRDFVTILELQKRVAELEGALVAAEELYQIGMFDAPTGMYDRVNHLRQIALAALAGETGE